MHILFKQYIYVVNPEYRFFNKIDVIKMMSLLIGVVLVLVMFI